MVSRLGLLNVVWFLVMFYFIVVGQRFLFVDDVGIFGWCEVEGVGGKVWVVFLVVEGDYCLLFYCVDYFYLCQVLGVEVECGVLEGGVGFMFGGQ